MTQDQPLPEAIRQDAARWITLSDADLLEPADEQALQDWLAADPRHAAAFARLNHSWQVADKAIRAPRALPRPSRLRRWMPAAVAATLALAVIGAAQDWPTRLRADAMTDIGEQRDIALQDGSHITLNTGSAVVIRYAPGRRTIRLLKEEAAFTVAPDPARPLTVEAQDGSTTALGTHFIVRRAGGDTVVTVTQHKVRVASANGAIDLSEGQTTHYGPAGIAPPAAVDARTASAWTRGHLVFVDQPLDAVVAELNRYHPGHIGVIGADLAHRRFSGVLPVRNPVEALDAIETSLGIASTRLTNRLIFLHR